MLASGVDLPTVLVAGRAIHGAQFNPQSTLKALSYFEDGNLRRLPEPVKDRLRQAVRDVDLDRLPALPAARRARRLGPGGHAMKTIPLTPETEALARRIVWFEEPKDALADTFRLAAYAFARATHEDMKLLRAFLNDDDLREALDHAPPGIIDARSWAYWNLKLGRSPAPPMPKRQL